MKVIVPLVLILILASCAGLTPSPATKPTAPPTTIKGIGTMPSVQEWCNYVRANFGDVDGFIAHLNQGVGGGSFEQSYRDTWTLC